MNLLKNAKIVKHLFGMQHHRRIKKMREKKTGTMKNFEKYKKEVYEAIVLSNSGKLLVRARIKFNPFVDNYRENKDRLFAWLFEEYQVPVLDDVEKEYLSAVIKPFKGDVDYICKRLNHGGYYIAIVSNGSDVMKLPYFPNNEMYKGMELDRIYKLRELGL